MGPRWLESGSAGNPPRVRFSAANPIPDPRRRVINARHRSPASLSEHSATAPSTEVTRYLTDPLLKIILKTDLPRSRDSSECPPHKSASLDGDVNSGCLPDWKCGIPNLEDRGCRSRIPGILVYLSLAENGMPALHARLNGSLPAPINPNGIYLSPAVSDNNALSRNGSSVQASNNRNHYPRALYLFPLNVT